MSLLGKGASSFRKKDVMEQKGIALGFKKIRFAHKATLGDTGINLTTLITPTEMSTYGFVNPNASALAAAQLNVFRNNLKLISSTKGLLVDQLSYSVASSTQINFIDFTADDGEIFVGWLDEAPTTSLSVVDGQNIIASGTLAAGTTDFNIGMPIPINQNSSQQIGAVMVFADRALQYRKVGNVTGGDGDYIEVPVAGGLGSLIRFNASGSDRFITVMSMGVVAERPDGSMTALLERVQGQVDAMVPTLAALAGVPETNFQTAPNDIDLKQFGDQVIENTTDIADHEARIDTLEADVIPVVNGHWENNAGTTINNVSTIVPFATTTFETNPGSFVGGVFTAPSKGRYAFAAHAFSTTTLPATTAWYWQARKNATTNYAQDVKAGTGAANTSNCVGVHGLVDLNAGDTLAIYSNLDTATSITLQSGSGVNAFSIWKVGP